jgi:uncharacterized protein
MSFDTHKPLDLVKYAERYATRISRRSSCHGPGHWRGVARVGAAIAVTDERIDPMVVLTFAAFHDTRRINDWRDPQHGPRAAERVQKLADAGRLPLNRQQIETLVFALEYHDAGATHPNPTVGACWDADRLTLGRVGTRPDLRYISTRAVRAAFPTFVRLGYATIRGRDTSWASVVDEYEYLTQSRQAATVSYRAASEGRRREIPGGSREHRITQRQRTHLPRGQASPAVRA